MSDVTRIPSAIEQGDPPVARQLLPLVYDELCKLDEPLTRPGVEDPTPRGSLSCLCSADSPSRRRANAPGLSHPVADRNWKYARAWLREAPGKAMPKARDSFPPVGSL